MRPLPTLAGTLMPFAARYERIASASSVSTEIWFSRSDFGSRSGNSSIYCRSLILMNVSDSEPSAFFSENGSSYPRRSL